MIGGEEASEMAMFALMMDHFFDCLNVETIHQKNTVATHSTSHTDPGQTFISM